MPQKTRREKYSHLYDKYKERERETAREYYRKNREKILEARRGNPNFLAKKRVYFNQWKKKNIDKYNAVVYNWKATGSGVFSCFSRNAKARGIEVLISREAFLDWYSGQEQFCVYCGLTIEQIKLLPKQYVRRSGAKRFSVDRKDNDKGYAEGNLVLSCYMCNTIKNSFLSYDEMKMVGDLVIKPKMKQLLEANR
jgi:hypothetical protein